MTLDLIETLKTSIYTPKSHQQHETTIHFHKLFLTKKRRPILFNNCKFTKNNSVLC